MQEELNIAGANKITYPELKHKVVELLNKKEQMDEFRDLDIHILYKGESLIAKDIKINDANANSISFYSNDYKLSYTCMLKIFLVDNLLLIIISSVLIIYVWSKVILIII